MTLEDRIDETAQRIDDNERILFAQPVPSHDSPATCLMAMVLWLILWGVALAPLIFR